MIFPRLQRGNGLIPNMANTIDRICDILPQLQIEGDGTTTNVTHTCQGQIITSKVTAGGINGGGVTTLDDPLSACPFHGSISGDILHVNEGMVYIPGSSFTLSSANYELSGIEDYMFVHLNYSNNSITADTITTRNKNPVNISTDRYYRILTKRRKHYLLQS